MRVGMEQCLHGAAIPRLATAGTCDDWQAQVGREAELRARTAQPAELFAGDAWDNWVAHIRSEPSFKPTNGDALIPKPSGC
jgi:hypothetical protein